ncbi:uncharacterized protein LOC128683747 [Plodia interpunctella]|uniref:uncharacterized protein LOC128683747 n=1 Tax=Plodia interpunctella TaxID=58824 RepID=UPI002367AF90|nr:uncharacterized protein LOC128683747 [Plodia interpunctella]
MKAVVSLCIFGVALVAAAPTLKDGPVPQPREAAMYNTQPQILREKRSQYPQAGGYGSAYASPCGGIPLPLAPLPAPLPAPSPYLQPTHGYGHGYAAPHPYGYGVPHYRSDDMADMGGEQEFFPDMDNMMTEHIPMARYGGYGAAPVAHIGGGLAGLAQLAPAGAAGPAFGVFPNANVGGCNVPLLLSCSPSIVPGKLVKSGYGGGYAIAPANAYRVVDEPQAESHEEQLHEEHEPAHDQVTSVSDATHANTHHQ